MPWVALQFRMYVGGAVDIAKISRSCTDFKAFAKTLPTRATLSYIMAINTDDDDWASLRDKLRSTFNISQSSNLTLITVPPVEGAIVTSMDVLQTMQKNDLIYVISQPTRSSTSELQSPLVPATTTTTTTTVITSARGSKGRQAAGQTAETSTGKKKKRGRKEEKHEKLPKNFEQSRKERKTSAYSLFKVEYWKREKQACEGGTEPSFAELSKNCSAKWKSMTEDERQRYVNQQDKLEIPDSQQLAVQEPEVEPSDPMDSDL